MRNLEKFSGNVISKSEMKLVNGGFVNADDCHVWHLSSTSGAYNVASDSLSKKDAQALAAELVESYGSGYGWCCGADC